MKILLVHNTYQHRGGEDSVVDSETTMLKAMGHTVIEYRRHNDEIKGGSKVAAAIDSVWSRRSAEDVAALIARHRPDVMHVHNSFPLVSPSVLWTASRAGVPVVMTLHNFRLVCPQAMFLRDGVVCEDCLGHVPWRAVAHKCYRESAVQSGVQVVGVMVHRGLGTYRKHVDRFIVLSQFARRKFIEAGFPADRLVVKPNFVEDDAAPSEEAPSALQQRSGGLFVGRLSPEKGLDVLTRAVPEVPAGQLEVIGHGPLQPLVEAEPRLLFSGSQPLSEVLHRMDSKLFLVVPSICYENFPRTIAEAFSRGLAVIASRLGGMAEIIEDGRTGLLFEPGDAAALAEKINWALQHPAEMRRMGETARQVFEERYTMQANGQALTEIYRSVMRPDIRTGS